ncbi:hypothetical protein JVU11DRAFT_1867 [Chiua virens]|nr:hypothetical protein JVU11DRAFT_1867 [Chiua virens]
MDTCTDTQPTVGDICQNVEVQSVTVDQQLECSDISLNANSVPDNISLSLHLHLVADSGDSEVQGGQYEIHPFEEQPEIQVAVTGIGDEQDCINFQSHANQDVVSVGPKETSSSDHTVVPPDESFAINIDDSETPMLANSQVSPSLCIEADFLTTASQDETAAGVEERTNWPLRIELIVPHGTSPVHLTDEAEACEDNDYPREDFPSSPPPSSSPPRVFSSSPCVSSQSSDNNVEPSRMDSAEEMVAYTSSRGFTHNDQVVLVVQDESSPESNPLRSCDITDVETSSNYSPGADSPPQIGGDLGASRKRIAYQHDCDESCGLHPTKRPKSAADLYLPPAPKRATVASHHRQFKKLAAPFRPPTKLSVVRDGGAQTMKKDTETTTNSTPEVIRDHSEPSVPAKHLSRSQPKILNTSRSVGQFKSPLINKMLPGDSRTIRLTPTVQMLERKLQLLKRAIKVKEDNEEEVLVRLAGKWIDAGREVAYDLWDATKDAVDLEGKATLVHKTYGWNDTNEGNAPWGWDTKPEDLGEGSCNPDSSIASCAAQRLTPEEDEDDVCNHTLGTMLRQLGIDPQTFGWDDDKEVFCD